MWSAHISIRCTVTQSLLWGLEVQSVLISSVSFKYPLGELQSNKKKPQITLSSKHNNRMNCVIQPEPLPINQWLRGNIPLNHNTCTQRHYSYMIPDMNLLCVPCMKATLIQMSKDGHGRMWGDAMEILREVDMVWQSHPCCQFFPNGQPPTKTKKIPWKHRKLFPPKDHDYKTHVCTVDRTPWIPHKASYYFGSLLHH